MQLALSPFQLAGCAPKWDIELSGPVTVGTMPWKEGHGPTPARQSCGSWPGAEGAQRVPGPGGGPGRKEEKEEEVTLLCLCWLQAKF